jgi:threonine-phosphate decarboxylase
MIIGHGGNIKDLAETLSCSADDIVDMSSNLNPLGPPETLERVICDNLFRIRSLPEPDALTIRKGFAQFHGLDHNRVVAGNGTTWFIYTIPRALGSKKVLIVGPTYSDYKDACLMHNIDFHHCLAKAPDLSETGAFEPDIDAISRMADDADTVFVCNPNNPTGSLVPREGLEYLIQKHGDTIFIVDESYLPFVENAEEISLVSHTGYENLMVLSSMSKIFRIPGLRTGFLSASPSLVERIMAFYQPWSVNSLAQAVIEDIFNHPHRIQPFYRETQRYITAEKQVFLDCLKDVPGLQTFDSAAYFILARLTNNQSSGEFCRRIGRHRILIRDCSNFWGLSDRYVRFSLKERPVNQRLADVIALAVQND